MTTRTISKILEGTLQQIENSPHPHERAAAATLRDELEARAKSQVCFGCEHAAFFLNPGAKQPYEIVGCSKFLPIVQAENYPSYCTNSSELSTGAAAGAPAGGTWASSVKTSFERERGG